MSQHTGTIEDFRQALSGSPITLFFLSEDGHVQWMENARSLWFGRDPTGSTFEDFVHPDDIVAMRNAFEASGGPDDPKTLEIRTRSDIASDHKSRTLKLVLRRIHDENGARGGALCSSTDISQEVELLETQRMLLLEVAHRSKNLLAMVLAIAAQTARASSEIATFMRRFTGRVQSMAKSQDAITATNWAGVRFSELVHQQVLAVVPMGMTRIAVVGADVMLTPNAATHLGLAMHELVNQSLLHGALSGPGGDVTVTASIELTPKGPEFHLHWQDMTGRQAQVPTVDSDSFSATMLNRVVPTALDGTAQWQVCDRGMTYHLTLGMQQFRRLNSVAD